jgi:hypothetical protein
MSRCCAPDDRMVLMPFKVADICENTGLRAKNILNINKVTKNVPTVFLR